MARAKSKRRPATSGFTPQGIAIPSPFRDELLQCIEEGYRLFGIGHVSAQLEACLCGVCMTEDLRQEMIATPNRAMPPNLMCEYSNSAHGTVQVVEDVRLLLPRYMELLADEVTVDYMEKEEVLWRVGEARLDPSFLTQDQEALLDRWAQAMARHFSWADVRWEDSITSLHTIMGVMIAGGWSLDVIKQTLVACLSDAETGAQTCAYFVQPLASGKQPFRLDYIFISGVKPGVIEGMERWFLGDTFRALLQAAQGAAPDDAAPDDAAPDDAGQSILASALHEQAALRK